MIKNSNDDDDNDVMENFLLKFLYNLNQYQM